MYSAESFINITIDVPLTAEKNQMTQMEDAWQYILQKQEKWDTEGLRPYGCGRKSGELIKERTISAGPRIPQGAVIPGGRGNWEEARGRNQVSFYSVLLACSFAPVGKGDNMWSACRTLSYHRLRQIDWAHWGNSVCV